ncbi:hypothetical protein IEQ34_007994 [Dendrobium chrysotoxum]|uniref:Uncharacterized protein n=1 Tax=Dendrobium chrysotoxum TaxID=161865 RepID=A0AAV7H6A1_DENCH|nr:hypothetical protein IEQ34_007994 [Dendrobium chrysotoxum]
MQAGRGSVESPPGVHLVEKILATGRIFCDILYYDHFHLFRLDCNSILPEAHVAPGNFAMKIKKKETSNAAFPSIMHRHGHGNTDPGYVDYRKNRTRIRRTISEESKALEAKGTNPIIFSDDNISLAKIPPPPSPAAKRKCIENTDENMHNESKVIETRPRVPSPRGGGRREGLRVKGIGCIHLVHAKQKNRI